MKLKRVIAAFMAAVIACGSVAATVSAEGGSVYDYQREKEYDYIALNHNGWCFEGTNDEAMLEGVGVTIKGERDKELLSARVSAKTLVVPSEIDGIPVVGTSENVFRSFGEYTPGYEKIYFPAGVRIIIPGGFSKIECPFIECKNLTDVYYGGSEADWYDAMASVFGHDEYGMSNGILEKWDGKFSKDSNCAYDGIENVTLHVNCKSIDDEGTIVKFDGSGKTNTDKTAKPAKVSGIKKARAKTVIKLSWGESKGATSYVVKYSTDKKTWKTKTVKTNSVKLSKLKAGTKYYFKVAAKNSAGTSAYSKVFNVTTKS